MRSQDGRAQGARVRRRVAGCRSRSGGGRRWIRLWKRSRSGSIARTGRSVPTSAISGWWRCANLGSERTTRGAVAAARPKRACTRCERRRPLPSSSSSPHALAWERASRPKPAMLAVNLVLRATRVEQDLARSDSRRCRSLGSFQCSEMLPRGSGRWGRKGVRFPAQLTRIVVSPAGDGAPPGPGYARAARSVATAARKLAPPAPARDACGPAIVIEMPRRPRRDVARPRARLAPGPREQCGR